MSSESVRPALPGVCLDQLLFPPRKWGQAASLGLRLSQSEILGVPIMWIGLFAHIVGTVFGIGITESALQSPDGCPVALLGRTRRSGMSMPFPIVVSSPGFHLLGSVLQGQEPVLVQALLTEASVERLDEGVVRGFPGWLKSSSTPFRQAHWSRRLEVNSGPLSTRMVLGSRRRCVSPCRTSATPSPLVLAATLMARLSRVKLSTVVKSRILRPSKSSSLMKSMDQD